MKNFRLRSVHLFCFGIILAALYYYPANYWRSVWWDKWFFVMVTCTLYSSWRVGLRFHWSVGLAMGYTLMSALWVLGWTGSYPGLVLIPLLALGKVTGYTYGAILIIVFSLSFLSSMELAKLKVTFALLCITNAIAVVVQAVMGAPQSEMGGLFGNPSISGCFTAFSYPLLLTLELGTEYRRWLWPVWVLLGVTPILAVVLPGASQPMGVMLTAGIAALMHYKLKDRGSWRAVCSFLVIALPLAIGGYFIGEFVSYHHQTHGGLWSDSGRFFIWKMVMRGWWQQGHIWVGQGSGTSQILIPLTQKFYHAQHAEYPMNDIWIWFHSDYVQALFENGIIGVACLLTMAACALKEAWGKTAWLFSALCGVLATGLFNFPAHFPLHALFGAFVLCAVFHKVYLNEGG